MNNNIIFPKVQKKSTQEVEHEEETPWIYTCHFLLVQLSTWFTPHLVHGGGREGALYLYMCVCSVLTNVETL